MKKLKEIEIIIDNKKIISQEGKTILEVAKENNIEIPTLCYHPDLKVKANCRICVVEIKGKKGLFPACATKIEEGMEIFTNSEKVRRARKINLELIFSQHCEECIDCVYNFNCQLLRLAKEYKVEISRFKDRKRNYPVYNFSNCLIFDSSKCIDCRNCVEVCKNQGVGFLEIKEKGHLFQVVPSKDPHKDCVFCGQCLLHCPAGAFEGESEFEEIRAPFSEKGKILIFQFAPAIRVTIGEEFGFQLGEDVTKRLVSAIKKLGADLVFDTCVGADFTSLEEGEELIERLEKKERLPMFTSCCPSWVKFVEFYHPELIPNLARVRSPHIILGGLIKTFWAEKEKIDPKKIVVVSIMPCISKKYEIKREELKINGIAPVDYVLTTRELARLFKEEKIDLKKIEEREPDLPLGFPSGAGIIYGTSGGVMESALRYVGKKLAFKKKNIKIELKQIRGKEGIREAEIKIVDKKIKIAILSGLGKTKEIIKEIKENPSSYDYIEVMACPGGCIGGGGQPLPTNFEIRKKRGRSLYKIDSRSKIRLPDENPVVKEVYEKFFTSKEKVKSICYTKFFPKKREVKIYE